MFHADPCELFRPPSEGNELEDEDKDDAEHAQRECIRLAGGNVRTWSEKEKIGRPT